MLITIVVFFYLHVMLLHGKLVQVAVASRWLLNFFFLNSNDDLDAVLSTDLGEQRRFKDSLYLKQNKNNLFHGRLRKTVRCLWFLWCEDLACDWLQHNKHSRHILGVHGNIISAVKKAQKSQTPTGFKLITSADYSRLSPLLLMYEATDRPPL